MHRSNTIPPLVLTLVLAAASCERSPSGGEKGIVKWSQLGIQNTACKNDEIIRVSRQSSSGTWKYFQEEVLGKNRDYKQGAMELSGSKDIVTLVGRTPCAIGYSGMGYHDPSVKWLKISKKKGEPGVAPSMEAVLNHTYPIARKLYMITLGEPAGEVKAYLDWIVSPEGQKVVEKEGYVPIPKDQEKPAPPSGAAPAGGKTIKNIGSDTMVNLAGAWASAYKKVRPEASVQVSGGGSGVGISALEAGTVDIANASREIEPNEVDTTKKNTGKEPKVFVVGLDALAVYVHKDNPLESISIEELAEIYGDVGK